MEPGGCCCCFSPRRGSVGIAITQLVLYVLFFLALLITLVMTWWRTASRLHIGVLLANIIFFAINVTFNILLLRGAQKSHKRMVLAWIVYQGVVCGLESLAILGTFLAAGIHHDLPRVVIIQTCGFVMVPLWYWFFVGIRHYRDLSQQSSSTYSHELDDSV